MIGYSVRLGGRRGQGDSQFGSFLLKGAAMATEWFFRTIGVQEVGPISSAELRDLAARGMLSRGTLVKNGHEGKWVSAESVEGLFVVAAARSSLARIEPPPECASENHPTQSSKARFAPPRRYTLRRMLVTAIGAVCVALVAVAVAGLAAIRTRVTERQQAPQAARDALNAIKQLHAQTDVEVTRAQYVEAVAKASVEVKTFENHPRAKSIRILLLF